MKTYGKPRKLEFQGALSNVYYVRVNDRATGRRQWISTKCTSLKAAREWIRTQELYQAMGPDRARAQKTSEMTFEEAYGRWISEKEDTVSPERFRIYQYRGDAFWVPFFGKKKLYEITPETIVEYQGKRRKGLILSKKKKTDPKKKTQKVTNTTVNDDIRDLSGLFNYCVRNDWILKSPTKGVEKKKTKIRRRIRSLSPEEEEKLLTACRASEVVEISAKRNIGSRAGGKVSKKRTTFTQTVSAPGYLYPLVLTALNCGFRRRTLLCIRWRDIDFNKQEWRIPAEFLKVPEDYHAPVPELVIHELHAYRDRLLQECETKGTPPMERLGPDSSIFGLTPTSSFRKSFSRATKRAGLEGLTFHDLRRIYLNKLRKIGVSLEATMSLTAHRSVSTVMKYYREVPQDELKDAVKGIDRNAVESS